MSTYRVGVDIGGTFTDIVLVGADGAVHTKKISSSVEDYARAIVDGLAELFAERSIAPGAIEEVRHGTTVASNAILEQKGARVGLITTKGFRDVLEIRTLRVPRLYDMAWTKPPPLVERYLRQVVDERIDFRGRIERALDPADAERAVGALLAEKVEAIAVCLLNSFANPVHELMLRDIVRRRAPGLPLCVSYEVLPEIKEYERTSTTVINAYVMPIVATYLLAMRRRLDAAHIPARLLLMQSNGGLTTDKAAAERPMNIIEFGPRRRRHRRAGAGGRSRPGSDHHLRHGRHHRQGLDGGARPGDARARICGRCRHHGRLAAADGRGLYLEGAGHRPGRGRRRRRLARVDRCRRRPAGGAAERRRGARAGVLRRRRHRADGDRRQRDPRPPQSEPPRRRGAGAQCREGARRFRGPPSPSRWA